jgi:hypothetical protein
VHTVLRTLIVRDLASLRDQIAAYPDEESLWKLPPGISNSGGTLALHLAGNLEHFFGSVLAGTGYVRKRDEEFSRRNVPADELLRGVDAAEKAVLAGLETIEGRLPEEAYPVEIGGGRHSHALLLTHLATHLSYHLGQVDYHRRLVTGRNEPVRSLSIPRPDL